jgi:hypothetical protein
MTTSMAPGLGFAGVSGMRGIRRHGRNLTYVKERRRRLSFA